MSSRIIPQITKIVASITLILVIGDYFIKGGIGTAPANITTLQAITTRAGYIVPLVMTIALLRLYIRRVGSNDKSIQRKAFLFFFGFGSVLIVGLVYGSLSLEYGYLSRALVQTLVETASAWIGVVYVGAIIKGYMIKSWEGIVLSVPGLLELFAQAGLGNLFLPQLGELGIWIMRYPNIGGNIPITFAANIATISIAARILTGRQKLRAVR